MNNSQLLIKSIAGMLFLLLVMGAALFVFYGSLDYRLAWLYLAVFFISVLIITTYLFFFDKHLLKSRIAAGPVAEPTTTQKIIQSIAGVAFLSVYVLSAIDYKHTWSDVVLNLSYASDVVCALAFVMLFFVFKQNTFLSATVEVQDKQQVVSTGFYGIVRHPMYTGALLLMFFTPIALGSFYGMIPVLLLTAVIIFRAIDEEQELKKNLNGYKDYCNKVKYRLVPFVF